MVKLFEEVIEAKKRRPNVHVTREQINELYFWLRQGKTMAEFCRRPDTSDSTNILDWIRKNGEMETLYEDARRAGHDEIAHQLRRVARGDEGFTSGDVQRDKLIIETDLRLLAKWDNRYNDRVTVQGDKNNPIQISYSARIDELQQRLLVDVTPAVVSIEG